MPRRLLPLLLPLVLMLAPAACAGDAAVAPATTVAVTQPGDADTSCAKPGVVRPNCGTSPEDAGDRGGALQYTVWGLLVAGLALIFTVVFRSAKRVEQAKRLEVGDRNWS